MSATYVARVDKGKKEWGVRISEPLLGLIVWNPNHTRVRFSKSHKLQFYLDLFCGIKACRGQNF